MKTLEYYRLNIELGKDSMTAGAIPWSTQPKCSHSSVSLLLTEAVNTFSLMA